MNHVIPSGNEYIVIVCCMFHANLMMRGVRRERHLSSVNRPKRLIAAFNSMLLVNLLNLEYLINNPGIHPPKMNKSENFPPDMTENNLQSDQKELLAKHLLENANTKPFQNVEQNVNSQKNVGKLITVHTRGQKYFECSDCPRRFTLRSSLANHIKVHTDRKHFLCSECHKSFYQKDHLQQHELTHASQKPFQCPGHGCQKRFKLRPYLTQHRKNHIIQKPFACSICQKRFSLKTNCQTHERTHSGLKPYECLKCDRTFGQQSNLDFHKLTHTGQKPFQCQESDCQKDFRQQSNLNFHRLMHTGQKPFQCTKCQTRFRQSSNLIVHQRSHTKLKPEEPRKDCQKAEKQNDHLTAHQQLEIQDDQMSDSTGDVNVSRCKSESDSLPSNAIDGAISMFDNQEDRPQPVQIFKSVAAMPPDRKRGLLEYLSSAMGTQCSESGKITENMLVTWGVRWVFLLENPAGKIIGTGFLLPQTPTSKDYILSGICYQPGMIQCSERIVEAAVKLRNDQCSSR
eukprot:291692_1